MAYFGSYKSNRSSPQKNAQATNKVPFRSATPGQLQDVTLGAQLDGAAPLHYRLTADRHSPSRGRTMKEYDQQIGTLKNENFNLKLRVYFLERRIEEQVGASNVDVFKENVELKVEVGSLEKELTDKKELLRTASNALEVLEVEKEELQQQLISKIHGLEDKILQLQQTDKVFGAGVDDKDCCDSSVAGSSSPNESLYKQAFAPLPQLDSTQVNNMADYKAKVDELQVAVDSLTADLCKSQSRILELENSVSAKESQIQEKDLKSLKRNKMIQGLVSAVKNKEKQVMQLQKDLDELGFEFKQAKEQLNELLKKNPVNNITTRLSSAAAAADVLEEVLEKGDNSLVEELTKEKEKLELAWRDAVKQRDETIQDIQDRMQLERQKSKEKMDAVEQQFEEQLCNEYDYVQKLLNALQERDDVLQDTIHLISTLETSDQLLHDSVLSICGTLKPKLQAVQTKNYKIQDLQKELSERDNKIHGLFEVVQDLRKQVEESNALVGNKDAMIERLQKSLLNSDKKLEELLAEKTRGLLENEKTVENFLAALKDKDTALKDMHEQLALEQSTRQKETEHLQAEIKKKMIDIKNSETQYRMVEEQLKATSGTLTEESMALRQKLQAKEEFIAHLKEYLEKLLRDTADNSKAQFDNLSDSGKNTTNYDNNDIADLEQKLTDIETRLRTSWMHNKTLENELVCMKKRVFQIRKTVEEANSGGEGRGFSSNDETSELEGDLQSLQHEVQALANLNNLLQRQIELTSQSATTEPDTGFNPQLIIEMAREITRLNAALESTSLRSPDKPQNDSNEVVEHDSSANVSQTKTSSLSGSLKQTADQSGTSLTSMLHDAGNEITRLKAKLSSTETTVHVLGNKIKQYRKMLAEGGITSITPPPNTTDLTLDMSSVGTERVRSLVSVTSRRSVSAEELNVGRDSPLQHVRNVQDHQAVSADNVLVNVNATETGELVLLEEKRFAVTRPINMKTNVNQALAKAFGESNSGFCKLPVDRSNLTMASPYNSDGTMEYGLSNDILELKEQICWLKLCLEQRDIQLQALVADMEASRIEMNSTFPTFNQSSVVLQEQTLTPLDPSRRISTLSPERRNLTFGTRAAVAHAACQAGTGLVQKSKHKIFEFEDEEIQWLYQENALLQSKLNSLVGEIPAGADHSASQLQQEAVVLRRRLCDSHDACELLRSRLEELAEFLEQLLRFDENGVLDTSRLTPQELGKLRRRIAESRELSHSLSQSLLVDLDASQMSQLSCIGMADRTHSTMIVSDDESCIEQGVGIRRAFHTKVNPLENVAEDMQMTATPLTDLQEQLSEKTDLVDKLRSQIQLLQEQVRQRDIENAWNEVESQSRPMYTSVVSQSVQKSELSGTVERERSGTQSYVTSNYQMSEIECSATPNTALIGTETFGDIFGASSVVPKPTVDLQKRSNPRLEELWLRGQESSSNTDDVLKQNHSSYDDLILLLDTDGPARNVGDNVANVGNMMTESSSQALLQNDGNSQIRNLEEMQEQAIMAEYMQRYTSRQFTDDNGHSVFRASYTFGHHELLPERDRSLNHKVTKVASPSDSESWSEPDRDVSQQRMGLEPEETRFLAVGDKSIAGRSPKTSKRRTHGSGSSIVDFSSEDVTRSGRRGLSPSGRKSRSDPWDLRRLLARLQNLEVLNANLRSELHIFHSLSAGINRSPGRRLSLNLKQINKTPGKQTVHSTSLTGVVERRNSSETTADDNTHVILREHLEEIRALRVRLEESITINDQLREKLEKRLLLKQMSNSSRSTDRNAEEVDRLCCQLEQKEQMLIELQKQMESSAKLTSTQESEFSQLKVQMSDMIAKVQEYEDQVERLQRELAEKDEAGQQLKFANQRLQSTLVNMQTALADKDRVNKELREANSRMQRALDAVDKLMQQRDVELRTAQNQREQLGSEMQEVLKKHLSEVAHLTCLVQEKSKEAYDREKTWRETAAEELRQTQMRHQQDIESLKIVTEEKERKLAETLQCSEELQSQLEKREEEGKLLQKRFDEMCVAVAELEKQLEREHGLCLNLQQKVNSQNKQIFEKENTVFGLQEKIQEQQLALREVEKERDNNREKVVELQSAIEDVRQETAGREKQMMSLRHAMEKMQDAVSEKKAALEKQLERAQSLEGKIELLSSTATAKELKCREERSLAGQLRERVKSLEVQVQETKVELKKERCGNVDLQSRLQDQEKMYLGLQGKLDERSTTIRKLEEELHQAWEDNEKLQHQVLSLQTRLQETLDLSKSMKTELNVYEHLHANISSRSPGSRKSCNSKIGSLDVNLILQEIRNLRSQLELSIQTNCALRSQVEEQFSSRSSDVVTVEVPPLIKASDEFSIDDVAVVPSLPRPSSPPILSTTFLAPTRDDDCNAERKATKKANRLSWNDSPSERPDSDDPDPHGGGGLLKPHLADSGTFSENDCHSKTSFVRQQSKSSDCMSEGPAGGDTFEASRTKGQLDREEKKRRISNLKLPIGPNDVFNSGHGDSHSIYSSPDLGIESDPNHFSSLEQKMSQLTGGSHSRKLSASYRGKQTEPVSPKQRIDMDHRFLYSIGRLEDYELLKKEVEEGAMVLKTLQATLKERLRSCPNASPTKNLEYVTLKELRNSASNLQICLDKSLDVVNCFWTTMLPYDAEAGIMENRELVKEVHSLKKKLHMQKKTLNAALQKLASTNRIKEGMEKAITKQLTKTHDVLQRAKGNLEDKSKVDGC